MSEQRLIDANALLDKQESLYMKGNVLFHGITACAIENAPTIDPESLPIVQELRAELARVTAERDAAVADMQALMWYSGDGCEICEHKIVEQRHPYTRLGCKLNGECNPKWCGVEANK